MTVRPDVNIECADGGSIATKTIVDENKNQTRQTIYQSADSQVNKSFGFRLIFGARTVKTKKRKTA